MASANGYHCSCCGQWHDELPLSFGAPFPATCHDVPEAERERRCDTTSDQCVIDEEHFFLRACLELPIIGGDVPFVWGVWVTQSRENFERISRLWTTEGRETEPPTFGWLATALPLYPSTLNIKTMLHLRPAGVRPSVVLEPSDHPLSVEQRGGITRGRVEEIAAALLHGETNSAQ